MTELEDMEGSATDNSSFGLNGGKLSAFDDPYGDKLLEYYKALNLE
jgi:hypothetical protein